MAIARPLLSLASILLLAGGIVMTFFIVLSGAHIGSPMNLVYFLQANPTGVTGGNTQLHNPTRWTYLSVCGVQNGNNANCGPTRAAQAFDPRHNFGTSNGLPGAFSSGTHYYYLSRFAWVFYIIALFFAVIAFFTSALALCTRIGSYLAGLTSFIAVFFQALAAALMTAWTVQARNAFRKNGQTASLGKYAYGFTWAPLACYFLAAIFFCIGGRASKNKDSYQKKSYFGRKRSTRSRGSFVDSESQRRVKDEYE